MSARKSKATTKPTKAKQAVKLTPLATAERLLTKAQETNTQADVRAAAIALADLPSDAVTGDVRTWLESHVAAVHASVQTAAEQESTADAQVKTLAEQLKDQRAALAKAKKAHRENRRDMIRFAYNVVKVHKIMTAKTLAAAWGLTASQMSLDMTAGTLAAQLGVKGTDDVLFLRDRAQYTKAADRTAVLADIPSDARPTERMSAFREAFAETDRNTRTATESDAGTAETPAVEAHTIGHRFAALLVMLNKSGETIADTDGRSGADVAREVHTALTAYLKRTAPQAEPVKMADVTKQLAAPNRAKAKAAA